MRVIDTSIFCLWLAVFPSIIQGYNIWKDTIEMVNIIAENGKCIRDSCNEDILEPSKDGFLGSGMFGFVYKGKYIKTGATIAIKFFEDVEKAKNEIAVYKALGAYKHSNPVENIEKYGVPELLYKKTTWNEFTLIGISLLDLKFDKIMKEPESLKEGDILILFREVVRIIKFIHGRGICHGDLRLKNVMFRRNQAFIIDYDRSEKVKGGSQKAIKCFRNDWRQLLEEIATSKFNIIIDWTSWKKIINQFENQKMDEGVKEVFLELIKPVCKGSIPNYNNVYEIINGKIKKHFNGTAFVSWLTDEEKNEARQIELPSIKDIPFE